MWYALGVSDPATSRLTPKVPPWLNDRVPAAAGNAAERAPEGPVTRTIGPVTWMEEAERDSQGVGWPRLQRVELSTPWFNREEVR